MTETHMVGLQSRNEAWAWEGTWKRTVWGTSVCVHPHACDATDTKGKAGMLVSEVRMNAVLGRGQKNAQSPVPSHLSPLALWA